MKKIHSLELFLLILSSCGHNSDRISDTDTSQTQIPESTPDQAHIDAKKQALIRAYPDFIIDIKDNKVIFRDGSTLPYDDGRKKGFVERLDDSDIEDMFFEPYQLPNPVPKYQADAGRSRSDLLFKKMYGGSAADVGRHLVKVDWNGSKVPFTSVNGASDSLRAVAKELENYPELKPYLKSSGTFYWRQVRGAKRMSAHSYGIAFDIAVDKANYWQWDAGTNDENRKIKYTNRIPRKLVEIFQRHGFIWGGAWYHYDTMHFEFRPEILAYH